MFSFFRKKEIANVVVIEFDLCFTNVLPILTDIRDYVSVKYGLYLNHVLYSDGTNRDIHVKIDQLRILNVEDVSLLYLIPRKDLDK